LENRRRISASN